MDGAPLKKLTKGKEEKKNEEKGYKINNYY